MKKFEMPDTLSPFTKTDWLAAGIPEKLVEFIVPMSSMRAYSFMHERLGRQVKFSYKNCEAGESLKQAWKTIEEAARSSGDLFDLFINIPDGLGDRPLLLLMNTPLSIDVGEERARYNRLMTHVDKIDEFFSPPTKCPKVVITNLRDAKKIDNCTVAERLKNDHCTDEFKVKRPQFVKEVVPIGLRNLAINARATSDTAVATYNEFEEVRKEFVDGLRKFRKLLEIVDPTAKIPTAQWKSKYAAKHNYTAFLASLNHFLIEPKHSALATIANVNTWNEEDKCSDIRADGATPHVTAPQPPRSVYGMQAEDLPLWLDQIEAMALDVKVQTAHGERRQRSDTPILLGVVASFPAKADEGNPLYVSWREKTIEFFKMRYSFVQLDECVKAENNVVSTVRLINVVGQDGRFNWNVTRHRLAQLTIHLTHRHSLVTCICRACM